MKSQRLAKKLPALVLALAMCLSFLPGTARAADSAKFAVMSTSDVHGKVWEENLLTGGKETNNLLRVATAVNAARETYGEDNVFVVDNGDLYQGTPIGTYNISLQDAGLTEDPNPMALALARIGYTAASLGLPRVQLLLVHQMDIGRTPIISKAALLYWCGSDVKKRKLVKGNWS